VLEKYGEPHEATDSFLVCAVEEGERAASAAA